ncbi:MAG: adenylosuccinate synthetase [Clostridia bacterium]|nr:adenylosuccinate synthetase [Clostridia bacterium]
MIYGVIGSNYGDEGKGLMTDYLASLKPHSLVIRHNGGAQSGHTVELDDKRFIFHELSSGSMRGADTYWARTYMPDLYKLDEEIDSFLEITNRSSLPFNIYADPRTCITLIDDIFCNMLIETLRGDSRHGSCGMGINEADIRIKAGFKVTFRDLFDYKTGLGIDSLYNRLLIIRQDYYYPHVEDILKSFNADIASLSSATREYLDLLKSDDVLYNFCCTILDNLKLVRLMDWDSSLVLKYENAIFETGQGLLLDSECMESFPHVTASRTGIYNIDSLLNEIGLNLDEVVYVSRSYLTKHGAGPFEAEDLDLFFEDKTNLRNDWQGSIRFGRFSNLDELFYRVGADANSVSWVKPKIALAITHLNESNGCILLRNEELTLSAAITRIKENSLIKAIYTSRSKFAREIEKIDL